MDEESLCGSLDLKATWRQLHSYLIVSCSACVPTLQAPDCFFLWKIPATKAENQGLPKKMCCSSSSLLKGTSLSLLFGAYPFVLSDGL